MLAVSVSESRTAYVYEMVIRRILRNDYRPGQALNRREVAKSLGVSISPVNEAFAVLQVEGIVTTIPRKGTFVTELDRRALSELTIVRAALETEAARQYCGTRIREARDHMLELADRVDSADPITFDHLYADITFHRALASLAGNRTLKTMLDRVMTRSLLLAMEATMDSGPPARLSHRAFVDALCAAEPADVGDIVRANIFSGKEGLLQFDAHPLEPMATDTHMDVILEAIAEERT